MGSQSGLNEKSTRSSVRRARLQRAPWNEKLTLVLIADERTWPACLFILKHLMRLIIKVEKEDDPAIMTSKASPHMETYKGDIDDFRFHHYFDIVCGAGVGGLAAAMLGHLRLSIEETDRRMTSLLGYSRSGLLTHLSTKQRLEKSHRLQTNLHDELEPESLKPSLEKCNWARDLRRENASQFISVPGMCQTLLFGAHPRTPSVIHVFRSYQQPGVEDADSTDETGVPISLVNICRVTMANPSHYEHVDIHLKSNKPAEQMVGIAAGNVDFTGLITDEIELLFPNTSSLRCLLELGGQTKKPRSSWRTCWPFKKAQSNEQSLEVKSTSGPKELKKIQVSGLKKLAGLISKGSLVEAEEYCLIYGLFEQLDNYARLLVESRQSRARSLEWETFALSDRYSCSICRKDGHGTGILDEPAFFDHVNFVHDFHHLPPPEMFKIQEESWMEL